MTPDPIGQWGGINLFLYSDNNPINLIDPEGLLVGEAAMGAGALAATEAAVVVASGAAVAGVGFGSYYLTSVAIEDTWLGRGGIGILVYNVNHLSIEGTIYADYDKEKRKLTVGNKNECEIKYGGPGKQMDPGKMTLVKD